MLAGQVAHLARLGVIVVTRRVIRPAIGIQVSASRVAVTALRNRLFVDVVL